jgi:hypothetical protein
MNDWIGVLIVIAVVGALGYFQFMRAPSPYGGRGCTGRAWKKAFPNKSKKKIRLYLECFVDGMALSSKTKLKFHPNDQVIDIYRSLYGGRTPTVDNMECETFLENLSVEFGVNEETIIRCWREDITLVELFECVKARRAE